MQKTLCSAVDEGGYRGLCRTIGRRHHGHLIAVWFQAVGWRPGLGLALTFATGLGCAGLRPPPAARPALLGSLTVVPPGPVVVGSRVEVRLSLRNQSAQAERCRIVFSRSGAGPDAPFAEQTLTVPPGSTALASAWWTAGVGAGAGSLQVRAETAAGTTAVHSWPLAVVPGTTAAPPWLQGLWLDPLGLLGSVYPRNREVEEQDVRALVDSMARLGCRVIIITYVEYQGHFFYPSCLRFHDRDMQREAAGQWLPFDVVEAVLAQADRHGMKVFLGVGRGGDTQLLWGGLGEAARLAAALDLGRRVVAELWERYRSHPSLYGWYLTHEMDDLAAAAAYYDPMADACHAFAPDKPVLVAPSGTPIITRELLAASHVDIFAYQDAVGAGYRPGVYTYDPETRLAVLEEAFATYRDWHAGSGKHFWADLELWQMQGPATPRHSRRSSPACNGSLRSRRATPA
jgi:hypothetical protein